MKLEDLVKTALDELRMQMLGVQILFGFQFQSVFQDGFREMTIGARLIEAIGLALVVLTLGLLIAAPAQHRLVEGGRVTRRVHRVATVFAEAALLPFAAALGCDVFVALSLYVEFPTAIGIGAGTMAVALILWYGLSGIVRRTDRGTSFMKPSEEGSTPIHTKIDQMLTEARVILPGAQALLGFQFVAVLTASFRELPDFDKIVHFIGLCAIALTIALLLAPAAIHRLAFDGRDAERLHAIGSAVITVALVPFVLGLTCDFYIALGLMLKSHFLAVLGATLVFIFLISLWYALPIFLRSH
jgi:hypothetical protein